MARVPGTETHANRSGFRPGDAVRCRRSRANAALGLDDRKGLVIEVRLANARVLLDPAGDAPWLPNENLLPAPDPGHPDLTLLAGVMRRLEATRLDLDEGELIVIGGEVPARAFDEVRALFGARLASLRVGPEGVHEIATRLRFSASVPALPGSAPGTGGRAGQAPARDAPASSRPPGEETPRSPGPRAD